MNKELIGRRVALIGSHIDGTIIDETAFMLTISTPTGNRRVQKKGHTFTIDGAPIDGAALAGKPHERAKIR